MRELRQIEIAVQLAIDSLQQIEIERRRDAEGVVVGRLENRLRFAQIGAEEEGVVFIQDIAQIAQHRHRFVVCQIADRRPEKENDVAHARRQRAAQCARRLAKIGADRSDTQSRIVVHEAVPHFLEHRAIDVDRHVVDVAVERIDQEPGFARASAPELDEADGRPERAHDLLRCRRKDRRLCPRHVVLGQLANGVE